MDTNKLVIYVLSDSIGETGGLLAKAALSQFEHITGEVKRMPFITSKEQIDEIFLEAQGTPCLIIYTIVLKDIKDYIDQMGRAHGIPTIDIMSESLNALQKITGETPKCESGVIRRLDSNYFRKVEAVEFAVKYDDGKDPRGVKKADIVLLGVSRTSKTPLSMYLAHKNFKVANVPLVPEVPVPKEVFDKDSRRIVGLIANSSKLNEIRHERLRSLGLDDNVSYAKVERIEEELEYSRKLMDSLHCMVIDVSYKAIEETAGIIMDYMREAFGDDLYIS